MDKGEAHQDQRIINGLLENNSFIIRAIYEKNAPKVINYVCQNNGNKDAAEDLIQEVLIIIYNQAKHKGLQLSCPFDAYFFLLCKRRWLNELKKTAASGVTIHEDIASKSEEWIEEVIETDKFAEQEHLFRSMFDNLGEACKSLLKLAFQIKSMEEVAEKLGLTYAYARKKKSLCIGKLTQMIKESPIYNQIKSGK